MTYFKNKCVLITGACGTVGSALVDSLQTIGVNRIIGIDNSESEVYYLMRKYSGFPNIQIQYCDIRNFDSVSQIMSNVDVVIHCAALKHVDIGEVAPNETIATNVTGTQNIIKASIANCVERVLFTSSDKAVNPTNVMGATKLVGERIITAAGIEQLSKNGRTKFASTRFGNVLGSKGSVIPLFQHQAKSGGPLTLTDAEMTRFVMTTNDAVDLVLKSVELMRGGEVFITKMPVMNISDIANVFISYYAQQYDAKLNISVIGAKPGEKMYEELMTDEELRRTTQTSDFFITLPAFFSANGESNYWRFENMPSRPYISTNENKMTCTEISNFLSQNNLFE